MRKWTYLFVALTITLSVSVDAFGKVHHQHGTKDRVTKKHVTHSYRNRSTVTPPLGVAAPSNKFQYDQNVEDPFNQKIDDLISSWYVKSAFDNDAAHLTKEEIKTLDLPDSVIIRRLQSIPSPVPLSFNPMVKRNIMYYIQRIRSRTEVMLGLSKFYFPIIEEVLDRYELPQELKYLTIIESAINPRAVSPVGACGLWQLMYGTGVQNGLEINSYVDERRDVLRSTEAAAQYLKKLYGIFNDWHLVIAAYNCGPGAVQRAIARNGGDQDYWKIYYSLPQATRDYVPAYIAATYVFHFYQNHHMHPRTPSFSLSADTIMVHDHINFQQISHVLNISVDQIREYNPQYRGDVIPAMSNKPYALRLPTDKIRAYISNSKQILAYNRDQYFKDTRIRMPEKKNYASMITDELKGKVKIFYTIKAGDNVNNIAEWFKVRISDMRNWNTLKRNILSIGQKVVVYVPAAKADEFNKNQEPHIGEEKLAAAQKAKDESIRSRKAQKEERLAAAQKAKEGTLHSRKPLKDEKLSRIEKTDSKKETLRKKTKEKEEPKTYTIKKDESLWSIAKRFPGTTCNEILKYNGIDDPKHLKPGDKIKIPTI